MKLDEAMENLADCMDDLKSVDVVDIVKDSIYFFCSNAKVLAFLSGVAMSIESDDDYFGTVTAMPDKMLFNLGMEGEGVADQIKCAIAIESDIEAAKSTHPKLF